MATPLSMVMLWGALGCSRRPPLARGEAPDLVLITVDTLRPDRLGAYGAADADTPHIDALARRGVVFDGATTPLPRTTPALASMLTGLLPHRHGSREVGQPIGEGIASVVERFRDAGYTTVGLSGTPVAGPEQRLDTGFERFAVHFDMAAPELSRRALEWTDTRRPLLLWVHYVDPHFPYLPPDASPGPCKELGEQAARGALERVDLFVDRDGAASAALEDCRRLYDGEIATVDRGVGVLLDGLARQGRAGGLVVLSSDHGEHFGEEGIFYEHGPSVHDAALRIPLIVVGEGATPHRDGGVARLEDVAPTLLAAAGLAGVAGLDGADLSARLAGEAPPLSLVALAESGGALHARFSLSLRSGRPERRLCLNDPPWSLCQRPGEAARLFNHLLDPRLRDDVAAEQPAVASRLAAAAARWPVSARERTARTMEQKLTARPLVGGGYRVEALSLQGGGAVAPSAELSAAIEALPRQEAEGAAVEAGREEALRSLGYIE